jgi:hypothetical protein
MAGAEQMDDMIARIRAIPNLAKNAAPDAAAEVLRTIRETIGAGTDCDGKPWAPRKEDGSRPLKNAARAVKVAPLGTRIFARVYGAEAKHHLGTAKGGVIRGIIPTHLTPTLTHRIRAVLVRHFDETVREGE